MHLGLQFCNSVQISCCLLFNLFIVFGSVAVWFCIYLQPLQAHTSSWCLKPESWSLGNNNSAPQSTRCHVASKSLPQTSNYIAL